MDEANLFNSINFQNIPLPERMRPKNLDEFIGQETVIGKGSLLRKMVEEDTLSSFILWGPPGSGKTSLGYIISKITQSRWENFSAVVSGIKEVKEIMEQAHDRYLVSGKKTILFIDEIHRFNKAQQDAFLPYVEKGTIILIGATTENPSFSIISPLLSRMRVFVLKRLSDSEIGLLIQNCLARIETEDHLQIKLDETLLQHIINISSGDARRCFGILEMALKIAPRNENVIEITKEILQKVMLGRLPAYDKKGDYHYDTISALHKSMRNSDVDASLYYAMKMIESGDDPLYIMRRVIEFSTEDIGLADPQALSVCIAARETVMALGMPEAKLAILQAVAYNALAPKSNALYEAYQKIKTDIDEYPDIPIPLQIRNAPTKLMKEIGYGKEYQYAHNYDIPITSMQCLPDELKDRKYYSPKEFGFEKTLKERIEKINKIKNRNNQNISE